MSVRIIPRLDIKGPNLVKGIHLEGLRVLGTPERFARYYYEQGADELVYMDVVASLYGRNSLLDMIAKTSKEVFIPLAVGGGIRSLDDMRTVLRAGADKVSLNTAAIRDPALIQRAAKRFGSSTVLVSIEAIRQPTGRYEAFTDNGREATGIDACEWAIRVAELGAGEIMVTSVDREGTGKGFDLELTRTIAMSVPIPVIACGGARRPADVAQVVVEGHADAVSMASMLHYGVAHRFADGRAPGSEGNTEYLRSGHAYSRFAGTTIQDVKAHLLGQGIVCRAGDGAATGAFQEGQR